MSGTDIDRLKLSQPGLIPIRIWNELIDYVHSALITSFIGGSFSRTPLGTQLNTVAASGGSTSVVSPWDVTLSAGATPGQYSGTIRPGTVAGMLPSNILDTFSCSSTLTYWKCEVSTDGKKITSAMIYVDGSGPDQQTLIPGSLPLTAEFVFAISKDGQVYRTLGPGNPVFSFNQAVITDKTTPPPPGVPGVERWYNILVS